MGTRIVAAFVTVDGAAHRPGGPDVPRYEHVQVPVAGVGEVRIRVAPTAFIDDSGYQRRLNASATGRMLPCGV